MKYILLTAVMVFTVQINTTLANHINNVDHDIIANVNGMVCDFCAQSLEKVFGKEDSVNNIAVDLDTQQVIIDIKDNQDLSDEKIKELINWAGYDLISIDHNE